MKIYEIATGYTPVPAQVAAATESVVEELTKAYINMKQPVEIIDISAKNRAQNTLPITEVRVPSVFTKSDVSLGVIHKLKRVVYSVCLAFSLKKLLKKQTEKTVLHFHNQYNLFFFTKLVSAKLRSKAVVAYTNHNGMWSLPWEKVKETMHKRYFQEMHAMKEADLVFVLNSETKKNVAEQLGISPDKIILIGNGVNTDVYYPLTDSEKESAKEKINLTGKKILLQVGSVYENKGQLKAIEKLAPLLKSDSSLVYAFAGGIVSQEYYDSVISKTAELGVANQVRYLGSFAPNKEMNGLYNVAHATVFASEYEGFPLVCVESVSAGVPVIICSDISVNIAGGCVMPLSKENVENVLNNTEFYKNLCNKARKIAVEKHTWQAVAESYLDCFKGELNGKKT